MKAEETESLFIKLGKYLFSFFILLSFFLITYTLLTNPERVRLAEEIKPYSIESGEDHITTNIWSLRLKRLQLMTIYNPILALPGVDTTQLNATVKNLRKSQEQYLHYYEEDEQLLIKQTLHPFLFLESITELEENRRDFIDHPTYLKALRYTQAQKHSLSLLKSYTNDLSVAVDKTMEPEQDIWFLAGVTNKELIIKKLYTLQEEISAQLKESDRRLGCLLGTVGLSNNNICALTFPSIAQILTDNETQDIDRTLSYAEAIKKYLHDGKEYRYSLTDLEARDLPLVQIPNAACRDSGYANYVFTWRDSRANRKPFLWTTSVDELLFHDVGREINVMDAELHKAGVEYEFQPLSPYLCIDSGLDTGKISTTYYLKNSLSNKPLFQEVENITYPSDIKKLQSLERSLINKTDIISSETIKNYVSSLQNLLYKKPHLAKEYLSEEEHIRALEIVTMWRSQSGWLNEQINQVDDMAETNLFVLRTKKILLGSLFVSRGYFSILTLTNNSTLYRKQVSFLERREHIDQEKTGFVTYADTLSKFVPLEKLSDYINSQNENSIKAYLR